MSDSMTKPTIETNTEQPAVRLPKCATFDDLEAGRLYWARVTNVKPYGVFVSPTGQQHTPTSGLVPKRHLPGLTVAHDFTRGDELIVRLLAAKGEEENKYDGVCVYKSEAGRETQHPVEEMSEADLPSHTDDLDEESGEDADASEDGSDHDDTTMSETETDETVTVNRAKLQDFIADTRDGLDDIHDRLDEVESKQTKTRGWVGRLHDRVDTVEHQRDDSNAGVSKKRVDELAERVDELAGRVESIDDPTAVRHGALDALPLLNEMGFVVDSDELSVSGDTATLTVSLTRRDSDDGTPASEEKDDSEGPATSDGGPGAVVRHTKKNTENISKAARSRRSKRLTEDDRALSPLSVDTRDHETLWGIARLEEADIDATSANVAASWDFDDHGLVTPSLSDLYRAKLADREKIPKSNGYVYTVSSYGQTALEEAGAPRNVDEFDVSRAED